jgi:hypothetical protein
MPMRLQLGGNARRRIRDTTQSGMRPSSVVVRCPFTRNRTQVAFAKRNEPVEALAPEGSDEALAEGVRFWTARRRLEHREAEGTGGCVERSREDRIAVVQEISPRMLGNEDLAQLLRGPCSRGMRRRVDVEDAPGADLHDNECVDRAKGCRRGYDEVAGHDGPGRGSARTSTTLDHVLGLLPAAAVCLS